MAEKSTPIPTFQSIPEYDFMVQDLARQASSDVVANDSGEHAISVLRTQIRNAKKSWYVYSGKLDQRVYSDPEICSEVKRLLSEGGDVVFVVEQKIDGNQTDLSYAPILEPTVNNLDGKVAKPRICFLDLDDNNCSNTHFQVADEKMYRLEMDTEKMSAFVCFNDPSVASELHKMVDEMAVEFRFH
jgi:hypothetical protein